MLLSKGIVSKEEVEIGDDRNRALGETHPLVYQEVNLRRNNKDGDNINANSAKISYDCNLEQ